MSEEEQLHQSIQTLREHGQHDQFTLALADQVIELAKHIKSQTEVISNMMVVVDTAMTLSKINGDRLYALEERARGMSMQDYVDGREPADLGPTLEHRDELRRVNDRLAELLRQDQAGGN